MKSTLRSLTIGAVLVSGLAAAGCNGGRVTTIKTLLDDPSRHDKQTVRIVGTVEQSLALLGYGTYHVDDGTGKLWVVAQGGGAPRNGATVGVEGEFRSAFTLGDESGAVLMEKKRFTP